MRGQDYNRGVDAGANISVWGFSGHMDTDKSTTAHNKGLLCHPNYSDDRNITGSGKYVESGEFQGDVPCAKARGEVTGKCVRKLGGKEECAYCWAKTKGVEFHESGKKGPEALAFQQIVKGGKTPLPKGLPMKLGSTEVPVVDRQRVLGLNIATHPRVADRCIRKSKLADGAVQYVSELDQNRYVRQAHELINDHGYFLEPTIGALKTCAYRFQSNKDSQTPIRLRQLVMGYFVGK